jgi:hypothetical protein
MDDFVPSETIKRAMHYWWVLLLCMLVGGALGALIVSIQKPVYESQASITTAIDFAYAGRLSSDEEDYLISTIGDVIDSAKVLDRVKELAASRNISLSDHQIQENFTKSRQGYRWELTVRDSDPIMAQTLTQIWVESADEGLSELRENTLKSLMVQSAQQSLQNCFSQIVVVDPASAYCSVENISSLRQALSETESSQELYSLPDAILLSKVSTAISDNAYLPTSPVIYKRNLTTFAGAFCGLIAGLGIFMFGKPRSK